ncbi:hypothetical protein ACFV0C_33340 [Streptomyces sp. NPDC059568]|uniref:hypothetical protein n=1 Tax=unclassified Streptomyces TaxID=2593676 RepID=UPI003656AC4C
MPMYHAAPAVTRAAAARAAAARRAGLVTLLVLIAFLGMSLGPGVPAVRGTEPPPPASATREPAGEGQQDPAETEQKTAPGRTERAGGPRLHPLTHGGSHGTEPTPYADRCAPAGPPREPAFPRCVVLRC